jgi:hypothetical protein
MPSTRRPADRERRRTLLGSDLFKGVSPRRARARNRSILGEVDALVVLTTPTITRSRPAERPATLKSRLGTYTNFTNPQIRRTRAAGRFPPDGLPAVSLDPRRPITRSPPWQALRAQSDCRSEQPDGSRGKPAQTHPSSSRCGPYELPWSVRT